MVRTSRTIEDYDELIDPIRERRREMSGHQLGDPAKLGAVIVNLVNSKDPPAHLLLGSDALKLVEQKLASLQSEIDAWKKVTVSTDAADGKSWA